MHDIVQAAFHGGGGLLLFRVLSTLSFIYGFLAMLVFKAGLRLLDRVSFGVLKTGFPIGVAI